MSKTLSDLAAEYGLTAADFTRAGVTVTIWAPPNSPPLRSLSYPITLPSGRAAAKIKSLARNNKGKRFQTVQPHGLNEIGWFGEIEPGRPLVLAGGEEKVMAARKAGYTSICIQNGERAPDAALVAAITAADVSAILIAYDADPAGVSGAAAAALALKHLNPRILKWEDSRPLGYDLNNLILDEGLDALRSRLDKAFNPPRILEPLEVHAKAQAALPKFPIETIPLWARSYLESLAHAYQTPIDLPAMLFFGALSAAAGPKISSSPWPGWIEPCNLYIVCAMPSGNRKSPIFKALVQPIRKWESESRKRHAQDERDKKIDRQAADAEYRRCLSAAGKQDPDSDKAKTRAKELADQLDNLQPCPYADYLVDDATAEALARIMDQSDGCAAIMSDEGGILDIICGGRYQDNKAPNIDILLKGFSGGLVKIFRMNLPDPIIIQHACLTVCLCPQPDVIARLGDTPMLKDRGLLSRFIYSLPPSTVGSREIIVPEVDHALQTTYRRNLNILLNLPRFDPTDEGNRGHIWRWSHEAQIKMRVWLGNLESRIGGMADLGSMADWAAKSGGILARLAALLALSDEPEREPWLAALRPHYFDLASKIMEYALGHAQIAYSLMKAHRRAPEAESQRILDWLRARPGKSATMREMSHALNIDAKRADALVDSLECSGLVIVNEERLRGGARKTIQIP